MPAQQSYTVLKYPWHIGHDYELLKIPHRFLMLSDTYRIWEKRQRPFPSHCRWVTDPRDSDFDVSILHIDQWSFDEPSKYHLCKRMSERFAVPKILIIHGCNTHDGCSSEQMREFLPDDCHVVCNTPTALEHWSLPRSRYILHGFSPEEWWQTSYELPNVLVVQPKHGRHPEVTNDRFVAQVETKVPITWLGRDVRCGCFDSYRRFLSKSSIFFNPSLASANPRARAEAMLSGLAIVTTASHGEEEYIINGENGFCSNDEDELLDFLLFLTAHPEEVERIGKNGREMARDLFHIDRFTAEWNTLLQTVVEGA